jgi:NAD(P)-dependent dehydrogenase (short-subunit alcohol dehydrogenase family)
MSYFLMQLGATVVVASRSLDKCTASAGRIRAAHPGSPGVLETYALDTSDLESVAKFVAWFTKEHTELHVLVNNAGIVYLPSDERPTPEHPRRSKQGFDMAFATNYLGHFLLTQELMPLMTNTPLSRVVFIASTSHLQVDGQDMMPRAETDPNDPMSDAPVAARSDVFTGAHFLAAYANSKLSQMLHMVELGKRLMAKGEKRAPKVSRSRAHIRIPVSL